MILFGIIPPLLILAFAVGIAFAGKYCKGRDAQVTMGILMGIGFIFLVIGVIFAGCAASMRNL
jgi:hypothetical protein